MTKYQSSIEALFIDIGKGKFVQFKFLIVPVMKLALTCKSHDDRRYLLAQEQMHAQCIQVIGRWKVPPQ